MVWAVGDGAIGTGRARAVAATVEAGRPDAFLYLGDVYEYGTASDFAHHYDTVYAPLRGITLPTPGNHDWARRRVGYDPYWARTAGGTPPPWYAVTIGGWRVLSLNSEAPHGPRSAQVRWLRRQVARPGTCRLAWSDDRHDGALRLTLRPGSARFAFVAPGGRVLRSGSVRGRPGRAAPG
jgi:hypothetical protein